MSRLIEAFKNLRKQHYLKLDYKGKYAFVGIGNHSINNLYPVLNYVRLPLKYIVVNSAANAAIIDTHFAGTIGTNDFETVLKDDEITGVLICAHPATHFNLVKKALQHNKNVFVEKPPCLTKEELQELIAVEKNSTGACLVGMQKRYSPVVDSFKKHLTGDIVSYNYRFLTGAYPEGDSILDIFIHPLDLIGYLFGKFTVASVQRAKKDSIFIHLLHDGFIGSIELSTDYSWKSAEESLIVNTDKGVYSMQNLETLTFKKKPGTLFSVPLEKIKKVTEETTTLFSRNNFNPVMENNQLFTAGYYNELKNFISISEKGKTKNLSSLTDMVLTYDLITQIKNKQ
ncbi:MAG TPA: Gfo/Idh/MocA family oxidoreductase [Ferruginibacter sp.]|jgi:virulence factor|nr:Gfo/Idh/MocA family oxidoreductase [Ferruginibacter sp.]